MKSEETGIRRRDAAQKRMRQAMQRLRDLRIVAPLHQVQSVNALYQEELTPGDRIAIRFARWIGSWPFVIGQSVFLGGWTVLNVVGWMRHWDPYPFILMSLLLSLHAAYTAPLIIMAQNREAAKDRLMLQEDYETNRRAAEEIRRIVNVLEQHGAMLELMFEEMCHSPERDAAAGGRAEPAVHGSAVSDGSERVTAPGVGENVRFKQSGEEQDA